MPTTQRRKILLHGTPDEIRALIAEDTAKRQRDPTGSDITAAPTAPVVVVPERLRDLYDAIHDPRLMRDPAMQAIRAQVDAIRADPALMQAAHDTPDQLRSPNASLALLL